MDQPDCWYCRKPVADVEVEGWSLEDSSSHVVVYACTGCLPKAYAAIPQPRRSGWRTLRSVPKHRNELDIRMENEFLRQLDEHRRGSGAA